MLSEENIVIGGLYRITKLPPKFGIDNSYQFVGKIGKAKWANYRGVCVVFDNRSGYVIPYDCLEPLEAPKPLKLKKPFRDIPTIENVILDQYRYRFAKMPDFAHQSLLGRTGQMCAVVWNDKTGLCQINFLDGDSGVCSLKHLEDIGG